MRKVFPLCLMILLLFYSQSGGQSELKAKGGKIMKISSIAFEQEGMIPGKYTCDAPLINRPHRNLFSEFEARSQNLQDPGRVRPLSAHPNRSL